MAADTQSSSTRRIALTPAVRRLVLVRPLRSFVGLTSIGVLGILIQLPIIAVGFLFGVALLLFSWIRDLRAASYLRTFGPVRTSMQWVNFAGLTLEFGAGQRARLPAELKLLMKNNPRMERGVVDYTEYLHLLLAVLDEHGAVLYSLPGYEPPPVSETLEDRPKVAPDSVSLLISGAPSGFVKVILVGVGLFAFAGLALFAWAFAYSNSEKGAPEGTFARDAGSETYHLDGRTVTLTNGVFQEPYDAWLKRPRNPYDYAEAKAAYLSPEPMTPGKVATVRLTDKRLVGAVSTDGLPGEAVIFTFSAGGDSTYYYLTLRRTNGQWHGTTTNSILLGDRISVEAVRIEGGKLFVDTLDRKPGESLTTAPSVQLTRTFVDAGGRLDETN
jgi:hypothetical protein